MERMNMPSAPPPSTTADTLETSLEPSMGVSGAPISQLEEGSQRAAKINAEAKLDRIFLQRPSPTPLSRSASPS